METVDPSSAAPTPQKIATPVEAQKILQTMLDHLGLQTKVEHYQMDDTVLLHIATAEPGRLIGKHGQTLSQLQFLFNRMLQREFPGTPPIIVDCERYRERQRDDILQRVVEAADKVRRWGEPVQVGPFSAFERRIIHHHMQTDPEIEALTDEADNSDGKGGRKKMVIRIKSSNPA